MPASWTTELIATIYNKPFNDLLFEAHQIHRDNHDSNYIHKAQLLSIKTGACPEDCGYCSQSGHHKAEITKEPLMPLDTVIAEAKKAKDNGASRFCMGAAWRSIPEKAMPELEAMISEVKSLGLETCMTLGMMTESQALKLKAAGLDYYNHNIDTSPNYYPKIITTRTFQDRLDTLQKVRKAGIAVCCGGILGLGETITDRFEFLRVLANLDPQPESVPINQLMPVAGTPLADAEPISGIDLARLIATARILMPKTVIRLTAGRVNMSDELQAMCFFAGANSIFIGDKLLTEGNPECSRDEQLLANLGMKLSAASV